MDPRGLLLAGAVALGLTGPVCAQDASEDNRTAEGRVINPDANAAAPAVADDAGDEAAPLTAADEEGPEAAIVEEEIDETETATGAEAGTAAGADTPHEEAVEEVLDDAQEEALQNSVHILPTEVNEAEIRPWHVWAGEDETAGATHLRDFMAMDADGDLLLTPEEWEGSSPPADFVEVDVNSSGRAGFAEYRVWLALDEAEAAAAAAGQAEEGQTGIGGPLETEEPASRPAAADLGEAADAEAPVSEPAAPGRAPPPE